ncbi:hypothetical protein LCGC14_0853940 [marine sediment metagenome]|uniref:Uncharacterized protein n=1 Tax=marine sediment metagenome TaxID=412755 RepID=A0A0F9P9F9_9ZZZZ
MVKKHYTPNEMRANSMNSNNQAYQDSVENRADQLNPNNDEYKGDSEEE